MPIPKAIQRGDGSTVYAQHVEAQPAPRGEASRNQTVKLPHTIAPKHTGKQASIPSRLVQVE